MCARVRNNLDGTDGFGQLRLLRDLLKLLGSFTKRLVSNKKRSFPCMFK